MSPRLSLLLGLTLVGCGSSPPPAPPVAPAAPAPIAKGPPIDISAVPEPPNLVAFGQVKQPDALVGVAGKWTKVPLPAGPELVRAVADEAIAEVVDLSQPVDGALALTLGKRGVDPVAAFSVGVKSFDQAKAKLSAGHKIAPGDNGSVRILGLGGHHADEDDDDFGCTLFHSVAGGRLVCGEPSAVDALGPWLSRTMASLKFPSDLHVEVHPEPLRAPLAELRSALPMMARGAFSGSSTAMRDLVDGAAGEVVDFVNDAQKLSLDAEIKESGLVATTRIEFQSSKSTFARMVSASDRAGAPPAAFGRLPAESDLAVFGNGSDPKLFERPRQILGNVLLEAADSGGMPEAERKLLRELVTERFLPLYVGPGVYAKGYDAAGIERAQKAFPAMDGKKAVDFNALLEAEQLVAEQVIGWHLYQTSEPIAKVGPVLKDMANLWNRPAFAKWVKTKMTEDARNVASLPKVRLAPMPTGVALPKDSVHLEVSVPKDGIDVPVPSGAKAKKPTARKPVVLHFFAVPDGGATWLAFGLDAKLVAQKAAASLATATNANTLAKVAGHEALSEGKMNAGGFFTLRGFLVFTALNPTSDRTPWRLLPSLPDKGNTPIVFSGHAEPPSDKARAGASVGTFRMSRNVVEDILKLVMTR